MKTNFLRKIVYIVGKHLILAFEYVVFEFDKVDLIFT